MSLIPNPLFCKQFKILLLCDQKNKEVKKIIIDSYVSKNNLDYCIDVEYSDFFEFDRERLDSLRYCKIIKEPSLELMAERLEILPEPVDAMFLNTPDKLENLFESFKSLCVPKNSLSTKIIDNVYLLEKIVSQLLISSNAMFFDLETTMSSVHLEESYPICISFCEICNPFKIYVIYLNHESSPLKNDLDSVYKILSPLFGENRIISAHNLNFDRAWVEKKFKIKIKAEGHCTITMHHLIDVVSRHGLEFLSKKYLGIEDMKDLLSSELARIKKERKIKGSVDYSVVPLDILTEYVSMDSFAGAVLYNLFFDQLQKNNLWELFSSYSIPCNLKTYELSMFGQNWDIERSNFIKDVVTRYIRYVEDMAESMPELGKYERLILTITSNLKNVVRGSLEGLEDIVEYEKDDLYIRILKPEQKYIPFREIESKFEKIVGVKFSLFYRKKYSLSSNKDMAYVLYEIFKLPPLVETEKGAPSTSEKALSALNHAIENKQIVVTYPAFKFCKLLSLSRGLHQILNTFLVGFPSQIGSDNLLHSNFLIFGTSTGRASSNSPNMQNVPSEENHLSINAGIKTCIVPRVKGNVFIEVDFSALEYRIVAALSKDEGMITAFQEGKKDKSRADIHTHMASVIYDKPYEEITKDERKDSKTTNFGILYGSGKKTIAEKLGKSLPQTQKIFDALFEKYPKLLEYVENTKVTVLKTGKIKNVFGMEYRLISDEDLNSCNYEVPDYRSNEPYAMRVRDAFRQSVNYTIQGPGGMLTIQCFTEIDEILKRKSYPAAVNISVHDSILIECPIDKVEEVYVEVISPVLLRDREWMNGVPLSFDAKVGRTAGCMISYEEFINSPENIDRKYKEYTDYYSDFENVKKLVENECEIIDNVVPF